MRQTWTTALCFALALTVAGGGAPIQAQRFSEGPVATGAGQAIPHPERATVHRISFDLLAGTISLADISIGDPAGAASLRIGRISASGVSMPAPGRMAARTVEVSDLEAVASIKMSGGTMRVTWSAPRLVFTDFAGPSAALRSFDATDSLDIARVVLEHLAATSLGKLAIPTLRVSVEPDAAAGAAIPRHRYTYTDLSLSGMRDGRIAESRAELVEFSMEAIPTSPAGAMTGTMTGIVARNTDLNPMMAALGTAADKSDAYQPIYDHIAIGRYTGRVEGAGSFTLDSIALDGFAINPAKFKVASLAAFLQTTPTSHDLPPDAARALTNLLADIYEGVRLERLEARGLIIDPQPVGQVGLGALRLTRLENGRFGEIAIEDLKAEAAPGRPVAIGRFAIKGFGLASLLRSASRLSDMHGAPAPADIGLLFGALEGLEIKGVVAPYKNTGRPVTIEDASVTWGDIVGALPTRVRARLNMSGPIDQNDDEPFKSLAAAGLRSAAIALDIGAAWSRADGAFVVSPVALDIPQAFSFSARAAFSHVTDDMFSGDESKTMAAADLVELGPLEIVIRDRGARDLALAQFARAQGLPVDEASRQVLELVRDAAAGLSAASPDIARVMPAVAEFIRTPGSTLTLRVTPKAALPAMQLVGAAMMDPFSVLAQVTVEATTGR